MYESESRFSIIKKLSPEVSNKIAAGEVVQRPASVVKELLDNAIDSGADHISIILENSGRTMIQIRDNGCGMSPDDMRLCFERHATSKVSRIEDLMDIRTLGFRGEAMASIASVAHVTLKSKQAGDENGYELELRGGEEIRFDPVASEDGTTVTVKNLFFNVPARRAFLKTDATEFRHILLAIHQAAIAHPEFTFQLVSDGDTIYNLPPQTVEERVSALFGKAYKASLIPLKETTSLFHIHGWIADPNLVKKTRGEQFLFINKRPFQHRHLNYIIQETYKDWIQPGTYPFYALFFEVDPQTVDVNVHPSKLEIKFEDERAVSSFTRSVVKKALSSHMNVPFFERGDSSEVGFGRRFEKGFVSGRKGGEEWKWDTRPQMNPSIPKDVAETLYGEESSNDKNREELFRHQTSELPHPSSHESSSAQQKTTRSSFWQIHQEFIITQTRNGMLLVDQHAAHKRIIYEKVLNEAESGLPSTQQLLFPKTIHFSATDFSLLKEIHPIIQKMGFNIQLLSGNAAMILGVPSDIRLENEQHVLESVMEQYKNMSSSLSLSEKERVAFALANKAAISRSKKLSEEEMEALVDQLFACEKPFKDPLGKATARSLSVEDLRALFR
ncbi:DNA mismatch repair endonuclease MutL [Balneolaceae bacterium ANBcel3]|nr:DNA mismatch repair endonuclease MutL [Balneolaceae bacterium ANBcel3]